MAQFPMRQRPNYLQRDMASSPMNPQAQAMMQRMSPQAAQQIAGFTDVGGGLSPVRANSGRYPLPSYAQQREMAMAPMNGAAQMGPPMQSPMQPMARPTPGNVPNGGQIGPSSQVPQERIQAQQQMQHPSGMQRLSPGVYRGPDGQIMHPRGGMRPRMRRQPIARGGEPIRPPQGILSAPPFIEE